MSAGSQEIVDIGSPQSSKDSNLTKQSLLFPLPGFGFCKFIYRTLNLIYILLLSYMAIFLLIWAQVSLQIIFYASARDRSYNRSYYILLLRIGLTTQIIFYARAGDRSYNRSYFILILGIGLTIDNILWQCQGQVPRRIIFLILCWGWGQVPLQIIFIQLLGIGLLQIIFCA